MLVIADADKKPKAGKATKEVDEPMRSAPITLSADGDANGFPAACPPEPSVATQEAETAAQAPAAQKTQQAYDVLVAGTTSLAPPPINSHGDNLFFLMGEQHLLSAHVQASGDIAETIEVQSVQASEPMIWRARVLKARLSP